MSAWIRVWNANWVKSRSTWPWKTDPQIVAWHSRKLETATWHCYGRNPLEVSRLKCRVCTSLRAEVRSGDLRIFSSVSLCASVSSFTLNVDMCSCYCSNLSFNNCFEVFEAAVLSTTDHVIGTETCSDYRSRKHEEDCCRNLGKSLYVSILWNIDIQNLDIRKTKSSFL